MYRNTTQYVIAGPNTFRLASHALFDKYGSNLQNIEKSMRKIYIPDKGKVFIQVDQSGAEAVVVAYLCKHGQFRDLILSGIKSHIFVGLHIFADEWQKEINAMPGGKDTKCNIEELIHTQIKQLKNNPFWPEIDALIASSDDWPAARRFYYIAKQITHSSNYGIGAGRFCMNTLEKSRGKIILKQQDAEKYLNFYHGMFPEIREWHREVVQQVKETNYLYNLFGFPRYFFHKGDLKETEYKEMYAFPAQSTVGTITNIAYTRGQNFIEDTGVNWDLLANTHDSYLWQAPEDEAMECAKLAKNYMEQDLMNFRGEGFKMKAEVTIGHNWGPYHADKNPQGLQKVKL